MFEDHNVSAVFSEHFHHNAYVRYNNIELITTSSCGLALDQLGQGLDPLGIRVVKMHRDKIEHKYYAYADLPLKLT